MSHHLEHTRPLRLATRTDRVGYAARFGTALVAFLTSIGVDFYTDVQQDGLKPTILARVTTSCETLFFDRDSDKVVQQCVRRIDEIKDEYDTGQISLSEFVAKTGEMLLQARLAADPESEFDQQLIVEAERKVQSATEKYLTVSQKRVETTFQYLPYRVSYDAEYDTFFTSLRKGRQDLGEDIDPLVLEPMITQWLASNDWAEYQLVQDLLLLRYMREISGHQFFPLESFTSVRAPELQAWLTRVSLNQPLPEEQYQPEFFLQRYFDELSGEERVAAMINALGPWFKESELVPRLMTVEMADPDATWSAGMVNVALQILRHYNQAGDPAALTQIGSSIRWMQVYEELAQEHGGVNANQEFLSEVADDVSFSTTNPPSAVEMESFIQNTGVSLWTAVQYVGWLNYVDQRAEITQFLYSEIESWQDQGFDRQTAANHSFLLMSLKYFEYTTAVLTDSELVTVRSWLATHPIATYAGDPMEFVYLTDEVITSFRSDFLVAERFIEIANTIDSELMQQVAYPNFWVAGESYKIQYLAESIKLQARLPEFGSEPIRKLETDEGAILYLPLQVNTIGLATNPEQLAPLASPKGIGLPLLWTHSLYHDGVNGVSNLKEYSMTELQAKVGSQLLLVQYKTGEFRVIATAELSDTELYRLINYDSLVVFNIFTINEGADAIESQGANHAAGYERYCLVVTPEGMGLLFIPAFIEIDDSLLAEILELTKTSNPQKTYIIYPDPDYQSHFIDGDEGWVITNIGSDGFDETVGKPQVILQVGE